MFYSRTKYQDFEYNKNYKQKLFVNLTLFDNDYGFKKFVGLLDFLVEIKK